MTESTPYRTWADEDGDTLTAHRGFFQAAFVHAPNYVLLTAAQCREVATHLAALADHHDHKETPMPENQHPLTETAAAEMWDEHVPPQLNFRGWDEGDQRRILDALHAVFDAGRAHEHHTPAEPLARTLLRVPEGHGAPHHDAGRIKAGDYVLQVYESGTIRAALNGENDD